MATINGTNGSDELVGTVENDVINSQDGNVVPADFVANVNARGRGYQDDIDISPGVLYDYAATASVQPLAQFDVFVGRSLPAGTPYAALLTGFLALERENGYSISKLNYDPTTRTNVLNIDEIGPGNPQPGRVQLAGSFINDISINGGENAPVPLLANVAEGARLTSLSITSQGRDRIGGGDGNDRIAGGGGADTIFGGTGEDTLYGDDGDDEVSGENGQDIVEGGAGNDRLFGNDGEDTLRGSVGDDDLSGGQGNDRLEGGDGDDELRGEAGDDVLNGGGDRDTFIFDANFRADRIEDFRPEDVIEFSRSVFTDLEDVMDSVRQSGGDTIIDAGGGNILTLENFSMASLQADDFRFV